MGVFNNIQRFTTFDISEYIRNFNKQVQTGLKLDTNINYDIQQKCLANVGEGVDNDDAVTKHQAQLFKGRITLSDGLGAIQGLEFSSR